MSNNELKKMEGSVLSIDIDEKMIEVLQKNNKIIELYSLESQSRNKVKTVTTKSQQTRRMNIKKIGRVFRKKQFDYIICNFETIRPYLLKFVRNSIKINKGKIYFYNLNDFDNDELMKRYIRYGAQAKNNNYEIVIDNCNSKTRFIKNFIYYFRDIVYDIVEYIGNMLVN